MPPIGCCHSGAGGPSHPSLGDEPAAGEAPILAASLGCWIGRVKACCPSGIVAQRNRGRKKGWVAVGHPPLLALCSMASDDVAAGNYLLEQVVGLADGGVDQLGDGLGVAAGQVADRLVLEVSTNSTVSSR